MNGTATQIEGEVNVDANIESNITKAKEGDREQNKDILKEEAIVEEEKPFHFKALIKKSNLEDFFKPASILVDEGRMTVDKNGIAMRIIDHANICMVYATLKKEGMFKYAVSGLSESESEGEDNGEKTLGMPIKKILKLIGKAKKNDNISIEVEHLPATEEKKERDAIQIAFGNFQYKLMLIDADILKKEPKISSFHLPAEATLRSAKFKEIVTSISEITDVITFRAGYDRLIAEGTGYDDGREIAISILLEKGDLLKFENESMNKNGTENEIVASFTADYLDDISKIVAKKGKVTLRFNTDYPCKVEANFADDKGSIDYMLAPRTVDNE